jgi:hypothetical protein
MDRTQWLQDRRMQKFRDVLSRWERRHTTGPSRSVRPLQLASLSAFTRQVSER